MKVSRKSKNVSGGIEYAAKEDLGRVPMKLGANAALVEQFTVALEPAGGRKAILKLSWDKVVASVTLAAP